jgi:hypothetical protein
LTNKPSIAGASLKTIEKTKAAMSPTESSATLIDDIAVSQSKESKNIEQIHQDKFWEMYDYLFKHDQWATNDGLRQSTAKLAI